MFCKNLYLSRSTSELQGTVLESEYVALAHARFNDVHVILLGASFSTVICVWAWRWQPGPGPGS